MKKVLISLFLMSSIQGIASPNFPKIERELKASNSIQDSIHIRNEYLKDMITLSDFHQLASLESLSTESEGYFEAYKDAVDEFLVDHIHLFLRKNNKKDKDYFLKRIFPSFKDSILNYPLAEKGLVFIQDCHDFKTYALQTNRYLIKAYAPEYCPLNVSILYRIFPILSRPLILSQGEFSTINLGFLYYIKKLYISASGMRHDAYFDVMVNGETKGTIYVPGRDPSYIISVEDYADQITLRSFTGTAIIESLQVEGF